jgi:hypothetical protein
MNPTYGHWFSLSGIPTYQSLEACDDLKRARAVDVSYAIRRRSLTSLGKGTNQIHGDTVIVAETGKKLPV